MTTMTSFGPEVDLVIGRLRIVDETSYSLDGAIKESRPRTNRFIRNRDGFPDIVGRVAQAIYDQLYTRSDDGRGSYKFVPDRLLMKYHNESLAFAIQWQSSRQVGWKLVTTQPDGTLLLQDKNGNSRQAKAGEFEPNPNSEFGTLKLPAAAPNLQQGWFHVRGKTDYMGTGAGTLRIYFNISRPGAVPLVKTLNELLNKADIAFHFKILDEPQSFRRADAAVLYFHESSWPKLVPVLEQIHEQIGRYLKSPTPLFSRTLGPGIGLAEDPGENESFGVSRSRLLAEGLWHAKQAGATEDPQIRQIVQNHFAQGGIPPGRSHLAPHSTKDYPLVLPTQGRTLAATIEVKQ